MQMRRYWLYQVLGWSAYSLVGIAINTLNGAALGPLLVGHALLISFSIGLTHWPKTARQSLLGGKDGP